MGAVRALLSKFGRRSAPCQIMALREQPVKFYGPPGPLLTPPGRAHESEREGGFYYGYGGVAGRVRAIK